MKEYLKPYIEDEEIIIEDICVSSGEGTDDDAQKDDPNNWGWD